MSIPAARKTFFSPVAMKPHKSRSDRVLRTSSDKDRAVPSVFG
jgi:hypothetical protein